MTRKAPILEPAVLARIDHAASVLGPHPWAVVTILFKTGMHPICLTEIGPANVVGDVLQWRRAKKARGTVCTRRLDEVLRLALAEFFRHPRLTRDGYYKMVRKVGRAAGVRGLSPMTFRHTRAVRLLERGVRPEIVAGALGCSLSTLQRFYGVLDRGQIDALDLD